jgi:hypothetical protein
VYEVCIAVAFCGIAYMPNTSVFNAARVELYSKVQLSFIVSCGIIACTGVDEGASKEYKVTFQIYCDYVCSAHFCAVQAVRPQMQLAAVHDADQHANRKARALVVHQLLMRPVPVSMLRHHIDRLAPLGCQEHAIYTGQLQLLPEQNAVDEGYRPVQHDLCRCVVGTEALKALLKTGCHWIEDLLPACQRIGCSRTVRMMPAMSVDSNLM